MGDTNSAMADKNPAEISLADKYARHDGRAYLTGIEALVRLPLVQRRRDVAAGLNTAGFVSGYRGSPVGTLDQSMWKAEAWLRRHEVRFQPAVNEDLAATAVWGSQQAHLLPGARYDGVFAMWYGKGPGLDRSMDAIKHANIFGTTRHGGVLAVAGDDHACKSSTAPHQSEHMLVGAAVPVLNPANVQEVLDYGLLGWALSRYCGCWVGLKAITETMDAAAGVDLRIDRVALNAPADFAVPAGGLNAQWPTTPLAQEALLHQYRIPAARAFADVNGVNRVTHEATAARFGIVTCGKTHLDVLEALTMLGLEAAELSRIGVRIYKVGMSWPLAAESTRQFAHGLAEILVVEEKREVLESQLVRLLYDWPDGQRPRVVGKLDEHGRCLVSELGELTPAGVARAIGRRLMGFVEDGLGRVLRRRLEWLDAGVKRRMAGDSVAPAADFVMPTMDSTPLAADSAMSVVDAVAVAADFAASAADSTTLAAVAMNSTPPAARITSPDTPATESATPAIDSTPPAMDFTTPATDSTPPAALAMNPTTPTKRITSPDTPATSPSPAANPPTADTPTRTPYFCSGCPHNTSTRVPDGSLGLAGIGCHYMVKWMNRNTETFTQMGGEGASWIGMAPFTRTPHVFQNLGDGTYFHSGLLAIRAAIAAGVNITYKLLYNDAVAMTGGQPVDGSLTLAKLVAQLRAEGIVHLAVVAEEVSRARRCLRGLATAVYPRRDFDRLQREFRALPGASVLIYDQTCAAEKRRRRRRGELPPSPTRVFINAAVCEGCGDCSATSNCLSVLPKNTELGVKRRIEQSACNADFSCLDGFCPSFVTVSGATVRTPGSGRGRGDGGADDSAAIRAVDGAVMPPTLPTPTQPDLDRPWNILLAGVGGSGVLTAGAVLAMAAHIDGHGCSTLNQTGLAQKFGAVASHVRIARRQREIHAARIPEGAADVLLGCDLVVAAMPESLARLDAGRAHAIVNSAENPTADFIHDPDYRFPATRLRQRIGSCVGAAKTTFIDATQLAQQTLGDAIGANLFLLGLACQRGLLPVSVAAVNQAIKLNGIAVQFNKKAFLYGRIAAAGGASAANPAIGIGLMANPTATPAPLTNLDDIIDWRWRELLAYQNRRYADRYRAGVERIRRLENSLDVVDGDGLRDNSNGGDGGDGHPSPAKTPLAEAVARHYFKLLAYKDEYEVARLYSNGAFIAQLKKQFSGSYTLHFHLAPPWLARTDALTGQPRKRRFPAITLKFFAVLARLKFLRGGPLDVFARHPDRRCERQLIIDYETDLARLLHTTAATYSLAIALASLPAMIKGFGHIKQANIDHYRQQRAALLKKFRATTPDATESKCTPFNPQDG